MMNTRLHVRGDLHIPNEIQDRLNALPLAPQNCCFRQVKLTLTRTQLPHKRRTIVEE